MIVLILAAEFVNGWTDAPNAIATVVSTRVLPPSHAVVMASVLNVAGAFAGTAVAFSVGKGIVDPALIDLKTLAGAMIGIIVWSYVAWTRGIPTSESHALIAGLAGSALAVAGPSALLWSGWQKVLIGLCISTFIGFGAGWVVSRLIVIFCADVTPITSRKVFSKLQICSAAFMAFSHGSNDGQKFIGMFALALLLGGVTSVYAVPIWTIFVCAAVMGIGTMVGGYRIIAKMAKMGSVHEADKGFAAETAAATAIIVASHFGIPLSTTQTINTAIMGVGASRRYSSVRWTVVSEMVMAWLLTFPVCATIAFISTMILRFFL